MPQIIVFFIAVSLLSGCATFGLGEKPPTTADEISSCAMACKRSGLKKYENEKVTCECKVN